MEVELVMRKKRRRSKRFQGVVVRFLVPTEHVCGLLRMALGVGAIGVYDKDAEEMARGYIARGIAEEIDGEGHCVLFSAVG